MKMLGLTEFVSLLIKHHVRYFYFSKSTGRDVCWPRWRRTCCPAFFFVIHYFTNQIPMTYKIYALSPYGREEIDQALTYAEASFLIEQYQSAYGSEFSIYSKP